MKKLIAIVLTLVGTFPLWAYEPEVKDIDITVNLMEDGCARITEVWDVVVAKGTEWYLVRENLGDIRIRELEVTDEQGHQFFNEGSWDVDRSISQKARRCGLHSTDRGYEICWGVENYGPHTWTVSYVMTNAVKTLNDFDMLHMQFVSDQLSSAPAHVHLSLTAPVALSKENSNIWAFGYHGTIWWAEDGSVQAESEGSFDYDSSMILLLRFDKGIFDSPSTRDEYFETVLERAREGAHWDDEKEEDDPWYVVLFAFIFSCVMFYFMLIWPVKKFFQLIGAISIYDRHHIKGIFGRRRLPHKVDWTRDIPFKGNVKEIYYVASQMKGNDDNKFTIVPAYILRMMSHGVLELIPDAEGRNEFHFNDNADRSYMSDSEKKFFNLIKTAAGEDGVLQEKEFNKWSSSHQSKVREWVVDLKDEVLANFRRDGYSEEAHYYSTLKLNETGRQQAMNALGFRQFLKDFTIINERYPSEVSLWGDYLIIAALFGMADNVARQMKRLAPEIKLGNMTVSSGSIGDVVVFTNSFGSSVSRANITRSYSSGSGGSGSYGSGSSGGYGGHSSYSGGGGFSGGGHGGGSR